MDGWSYSEAAKRCGKASLKDLLQGGRLTAGGRIGSAEGELVSIPCCAWAKIEPDPASDNRFRYDNGPIIEDLRVFPVLLAPNVVDLLHDRSLADVFMDFVIRDPELAVIGELVVAERGHRQVFTEGMAPGPFVNYHWSIDGNADELAFNFMRPVIFFVESPAPKPSAAVAAAAQVLAVRIVALRGLLASGRVTACGTHRNTGALVAIHRMQWLRTSQAVDVQNGDLCEYQNPKYIPMWTGILLERGINEIPRSGTFDELLQQQERKNGSGTTIRSESQCKSWLSQLMHDHPKRRLKPKAALFHEAEQKWSISRRAFERAWGVASVETGAVAWTKGGRTKTSAPKTSAAK